MAPITGAKKLKLVAGAILGLDSLVILIYAGVTVALYGWSSAIGGWGTAVFTLAWAGTPVLLGWLGLRWPGRTGLGLLVVAFVGLVLSLFAAVGGVSGFDLLFFFVVICPVPLLSGILFLVARGFEPSMGSAERPVPTRAPSSEAGSETEDGELGRKMLGRD
jgi:hypothetical protein